MSDYSDAAPNSRVEHRFSVLLSKEENEHIIKLLGHKCLTLATSVVQLYTSEAPQHSSWIRRDCGVLCLVKDNVRRSYFFRIFCPMRSAMIWEHEVYNHVEYRAPRPFLHTFEGEESIICFNFADEYEANIHKTVLLEKIEARKQRKIERRSRQSMGPPPQPPIANGPSHIMSSGPPLGPKPPAKQVQQVRSKWSTKRNREKDSARRLTKADIGLPQNFRHVTHVGWDPNKGFDLDNVEDPQLKQFFVKAGVSESQLNDRETRDFIYDFINRHGGIEAVKEEVIQAIPQAVALHQNASQIGPPPPVPARTAPPPVENKSWGQVRSAPPPPPSRTAQVPQSSSYTQPPLPPSRIVQAPKPPAPPEPMSANIPPPPPPPPMLPPQEPVATPIAPPSGPPMPRATVDPRSALLDAIKMGKQLKHVEPGSSSSAPSASSGDSRGELLDQIRQGIELRRVTPSSTSSRPADVATEDTLAGALARALLERSRVIHSDSDSDEEEDEEDDDEWD